VAPVKYSITHHSGSSAPDDALDLLWERLNGSRDGVRFERLENEIRATRKDSAPASVERQLRQEIGRRAVYDVICKVCENAPELKSVWYAVRPLR
jgi:hypothetical protein